VKSYFISTGGCLWWLHPTKLSEIQTLRKGNLCTHWPVEACFLFHVVLVCEVTCNSIGNSPSKWLTTSIWAYSSLGNSRWAGWRQWWKKNRWNFSSLLWLTQGGGRKPMIASASFSYYSMYLLTYGREVLPSMKPWPAKWCQLKLFNTVKLPALESGIHMEGQKGTLCKRQPWRLELSKNIADKSLFHFQLMFPSCYVVRMIQNMAVNF
jgi:hypothetical protein